MKLINTIIGIIIVVLLTVISSTLIALSVMIGQINDKVVEPELVDPFTNVVIDESTDIVIEYSEYNLAPGIAAWVYNGVNIYDANSYEAKVNNDEWYYYTETNSINYHIDIDVNWIDNTYIINELDISLENEYTENYYNDVVLATADEYWFSTDIDTVKPENRKDISELVDFKLNDMIELDKTYKMILSNNISILEINTHDYAADQTDGVHSSYSDNLSFDLIGKIIELTDIFNKEIII